MKYSVALFHSVSAVLRAEKVLGQAGVPIKLIPTPRELSSNCGVSLRFERARRQEIEELLKQAQMKMDVRDI